MSQPDPSSEKDGLRDNFTNAVYLYVIKNTFNQGLTFTTQLKSFNLISYIKYLSLHYQEIPSKH